jgi:putative nucleotidyltransferase with HDIG domain
MNRLYTYWGAVTVAALTFCILLDWTPLWALSGADWIGWTTFVLLGILSQYLAIESPLGAAKSTKSSIAFVPLLAVAVVMPVPAVIMAVATMSAVDELLFRDRNYGRTLFNVSQGVLSIGSAALVVHRLFGNAEANGVPVSQIFNLVIPFYTLALIVFFLNIGLVSIGVSLRQSQPPWAVLRHAVGKGGGNILSYLMASPFALFAVALYNYFHVGGLLLVVLPLLFIRRAHYAGLRLQQANHDLLYVLVKAIETRDPYTSGHSVRVQTLSKMIGEDFHLRPRILAFVETAALLHDIGKIDERFAKIISKPTDLTDQERATIQSHATAGAELLESLTSVHHEVVIGVRHHHERYDGTGYPDGLRGEAIPIAARIIMIADSVDAMLSDRPYRDALTIEQVRSELLRCAGSQFDPALVRSILDNNTLERAEGLVDRAGANKRRTSPVALLS